MLKLKRGWLGCECSVAFSALLDPLDLEELLRGVLAALRVHGFSEEDYEALRALLEARNEVKNK